MGWPSGLQGPPLLKGEVQVQSKDESRHAEGRSKWDLICTAKVEAKLLGAGDSAGEDATYAIASSLLSHLTQNQPQR